MSYVHDTPWYCRLLICPLCKEITPAGDWLEIDMWNWQCPKCNQLSHEDSLIEHIE